MDTRNSTRHDIFGSANELATNMLPTNLQVAQYFLKVKTRQNESNKDKYKIVADAVIRLWSKASVPVIQARSVERRVETLVSTGSELCRSKSSSNRKATFLSSLDNLFDVAACKCLISCNESTQEVTISCSCPKDSKVPLDELPFLYDQRNSRIMFIGGVDKLATIKLQRRVNRKQSEQARVKKAKLNSKQDSICQPDTSSTNETDTDYQEIDDNTVSVSDEEFSVADAAGKSQMRISLPNLVKEADRYGISDRATASLATAVLIDVGIVTKDDQSLVIDKNKVRRERMKFRKSLQRNVNQSNDTITSIYFDGRRDKTMTKIKNNDKWYGDTTVEDHYVLVTEPGGYYLTHVTPTSGKSGDIANCILTVIGDHDAGETINSVGCDSTNTNTGCKAGVIRHIEQSLKRPLNWFICMLHTNELPLRHLFMYLDGTTSGASTFTGLIGKEIQHCEARQIILFEPIVCASNMPVLDEVVLDDISGDQKYLYDIVTAIRSGIVSDDMSSRKPGILNHSRWLTLANRVCRLYISTESPSYNLRVITHFIVSNYAPTWFAIKCSPLCTDGAKHIYLAVQLVKLVILSSLSSLSACHILLMLKTF